VHKENGCHITDLASLLMQVNADHMQGALQGNGWLPHAHLVEAVLKDMTPTDCQPEATVPPVVIPGGVDACSEVGALVVELYEAGNLEQRLEGALQQAGVLPQQSVQQAAMLLGKPASTGVMREDPDSKHRWSITASVVYTVSVDCKCML